LKKVSVLLGCLTIVFLLSGCGNIGIASNTTISEAGSGVFSFRVAYDNIIFDNLNDSILKDNVNALPNDRIKKYAHNQKFLEEYKINFNSLEDLNKKLAENKNGFNVNVVKKTGLFKDTYTYEMKFLKEFDKSAIKSSFLGLSSNPKKTITTYSDKTIDEFISKVKYTNEVALPGRIISTNSVGDTGGNLVWTYYLNEINTDTSMKATYIIEKNSSAIVAAVVIAILFALIFAYSLKYKSRKR
jgi:hypothetical protein